MTFSSPSCFDIVTKFPRKTKKTYAYYLWFSVGIGILQENNLILLTRFKDILKPNHERVLKILKETRIKKQNDRIETEVRLPNRMFRLLKLVESFTNDRIVP